MNTGGISELIQRPTVLLFSLWIGIFLALSALSVVASFVMDSRKRRARDRDDRETLARFRHMRGCVCGRTNDDGILIIDYQCRRNTQVYAEFGALKKKGPGADPGQEENPKRERLQT